MVDYLGIKRRMNAALKQYGGGGQGGNDGGDDDPTNDISEFVKIVKDSLESLDIIMHGFDASGFYTGTPLQQVQTLNRGANFVLEHEERKTYLWATQSVCVRHSICAVRQMTLPWPNVSRWYLYSSSGSCSQDD